MGNASGQVAGIAILFIYVAFAALVIGHASGTSTVISSVGTSFNNLLKTVSLQS